jgi:microcystin-dependent protein
MDPFLGEITMFGGNFAPRGWADCDGQLLPINTYTALFSLLGTMYGGDGRTTFALPDMRSRVPMHEGTGPGLSQRTQGQRGGWENHTLSVSELPSHTHTLSGRNELADSATPEGDSLANVQGSDTKIYSSSAANSAMSANSIGNTGSSQSHNNMQPYTVIRFIIALQGTFPSRN